MTSVGSVELSLTLDTSSFDRSLTALSKTKLDDLSVTASLDTTRLRSDLKELQGLKLPTLQVEATLDTTQIRRELDALYKSNGGAIAIEVRLNRSSFDRDISALSSTNVKPIELDVSLSKQGLNRQLRELREGDYGGVEIEVTPNIRGFERSLKELSKSVVTNTEIDVQPNTSNFQDTLKQLSESSIHPLTVEIKAETKGLQRDLESLKSLDIDCIPVDICPDIESLRTTLKDIDLDCIPVDLCIDIDTDAIQEKMEAALSRFKQEVEVTFSTKTPAQSTAKTEQQESRASKGLEAASLEMQSGLKTVAQKLNNAIDAAIQNTTGAITAPFRNIARGFLEGIGQTFSRDLATGIVGSFQKQVGVNLQAVGSRLGNSAGVQTNRALGRKTQGDDDLSVGVVSPRAAPKDRQPSGTSAVVELDLKNIASQLGTFSKIVQNTGVGLDKFGGNTIRAAQQALELAAAFVKLQKSVTYSDRKGHVPPEDKEKTKSTKAKATENTPAKIAVAQKIQTAQQKSPVSSAAQVSPEQRRGFGLAQPKRGEPFSVITTTPALAPQAIPSFAQRPPSTALRKQQVQSAPVVDSVQNSVKRGFLKGDRALLTPVEARRQVDNVHDRLQKKLQELQQLPDVNERRGKVAAVVKQIGILEQRIAADIANPEIPEAVRRSLGQLKSINSKLSQKKRAATSTLVESDAEISTKSRRQGKLSGAVKVGLGGGLGASLLGAGGAFAAPTAGAGGLGALGALPFDPTLGIAGAGIAATFLTARAAGKFIPKALRKAGANKAADVLDTNIEEAATQSASRLVDSVRSTVQSARDRIFKSQKKTSATVPDITSPAADPNLNVQIPLPPAGSVLGLIEKPKPRAVQVPLPTKTNVSFSPALFSQKTSAPKPLSAAFRAQPLPINQQVPLPPAGSTTRPGLLSPGLKIQQRAAILVQNTVDGALNFLEGAAGKVGDFKNFLLQPFQQGIPKLFKSVKSGFQSTFRNTADAISSGTSKIVDGAKEFGGFIQSGFFSAKKGLANVFDNLKGVFKRSTSTQAPFSPASQRSNDRSTIRGVQGKPSPNATQPLLPRPVPFDATLNSHVGRSIPHAPPFPHASKQQPFSKRDRDRVKQAKKEEELAFKELQKSSTKISELNQALQAGGFDKVDPLKTKLLGKGFLGSAFAFDNRAYKLSDAKLKSEHALQERASNQNAAARAGLAPKLLGQKSVKGKDLSISEEVVGDSLKQIGKNLRKSIKGLNEDLIHEAAQFAARLHKSGVAHRDLHAGNILKDKKTGNLKAIDFDDSVNLRSLSSSDQNKAKSQDKNKLLNDLRKAYRGKLNPEAVDEVFNQAYETEFKRHKSRQQTLSGGRQRLSEIQPSVSRFINKLFDDTEKAFYNSPAFKGVPKEHRRSLVSEASGFLASGAILANPLGSLTAAVAPLLTALTPLIATFALVGNAVSGLVQTLAGTLQKIEPLQKTLEFTAGSPEGGKQERQFVQGFTEEYNLPTLPALEQFAKFTSAAKGSRLEGQKLRDIFEGIGLGAKALQLNAESVNLVMYAFTQILSKGKLSAEEIRLQLAEKFPPAVGVFSRALKVSQTEFNRLLESGSLLADDVLPLVGAQLKKEFGQAAKEASTTFTSAIIKVENNIFKLKEAFATTLAPVLTGAANLIGDTLSLIAKNAEGIFKVFSVVLIGLTAQIFVGLTTILEGSGFLAKIQSFLIPLYGRLYATLTPFAIGLAADFLDDVLGAQTSVMENLMSGIYNAVVGNLTIITSLGEAIGSLFGNIAPIDFGAVAKPVSDFVSGLLNLTKGLRSTVVEFGALFLILSQTLVLLNAGVLPAFIRFLVTTRDLSFAFASSVRSGKVFQTSLNTLSAGLQSAELRAVAATTAFILFFAKADFSNDLGSKFDKLGDKISDNLKRIKEAVKDPIKPPTVADAPTEIESKGFDLGFGLLDKPFRTDDALKLARLGFRAFYRSLRKTNLIEQQRYEELSRREISTLGEKQFNENIVKLQQRSEEVLQGIDVSGLLNGKFASLPPGKALKEVEDLDKKIKLLRGQKLDLLSGNKAGTPEISAQVKTIDDQLQKLLDRRDVVKKPIAEVRDSVLSSVEEFKTALKDINESDLPEDKKKQMREFLQPTIALGEQARAKLEQLNAIDLSPLGNQFSQVVTEIERADRALENALSRGQLKAIQAQAGIQGRLTEGKITPETAARETTDAELAAFKVKERTLTDAIKTRRANLKDLQSVPNPTKDQQSSIDKTQKGLEKNELELAQAQLQRNQKIVEGRKQIEERLLKKFQKDNTRATATIQNVESQFTARVKRLQLGGKITPETAEVGVANIRATTAKSEVQEVKRQIEEFRKLKKTRRISAEEVAQRELELTKQLTDANLKAIEAELSAREAFKQKRISDIEEIQAVEQAASDARKSKALASIKERQLNGTLSSESAGVETNEAEIKSAQNSVNLAKKKLSDIKKLRADGILNVKDADTKERESIASISQFEGQVLDLRLQKQQQFREKALKLLEDANKRAIAIIDKQQTQVDIGIKQKQLGGPLNETTDREAERATQRNQLAATARRVAQAQTEITQLNRKNFENDRDFINKRIELEGNLGSLVKQYLDEQIGLNKSLQDDAITSIQRRTQLEKDRGDLAVQDLENEKTALDLFNSSLDRSKQLLQSRADLSKALSDANIAVAEGEVASLEQALELRRKLSEEGVPEGAQNLIRSGLSQALSSSGLSASSSELKILATKQQVEDEIAIAKRQALEAELQLARDLLKLDLQRQDVTAQIAVNEAEIARDRALLAQLEAQGALNEARTTKDDYLIAAAEKRLELNNKIVDSTQRQLDGAQKNLDIQGELAANAKKALDAQQQGARIQSDSAERLRKVNQSSALAETRFKAAPSSVPATAAPRESSTSEDTDIKGAASRALSDRAKPLSLFEQSRLNMFAPQPIQMSSGGQPDQSKSQGLNPQTSVEAYFKRLKGLNPIESAEQSEKRRLGIDKFRSVEAMWNAQAGLEPFPPSFNRAQERTAPPELRQPQGNEPEKRVQTPTKPQEVFEAIVKQVAKTSGVSLNVKDIPKLIVNDAKTKNVGAEGVYERKSNTIFVIQKILDLLSGGVDNLRSSPQHFELLIHEIRHAFQFQFGKIPFNDLLKPRQNDIIFASPEQASPRVKEGVERSIAISEKKAGGLSLQERSILKAIETDAQVFAERSAPQIAESVGRDLSARKFAAVKEKQSGLAERNSAFSGNILGSISSKYSDDIQKIGVNICQRLDNINLSLRYLIEGTAALKSNSTANIRMTPDDLGFRAAQANINVSDSASVRGLREATHTVEKQVDSSTGYNNFVTGLKEAGMGRVATSNEQILAQLIRMNENFEKVARAPRTLNVSTSGDPVDSAGRIYNDITEGAGGIKTNSAPARIKRAKI